MQYILSVYSHSVGEEFSRRNCGTFVDTTDILQHRILIDVVVLDLKIRDERDTDSVNPGKTLV